MKVRYTAEAQADLESIFSYISERNAPAAMRVLSRLRERADSLGEFPELGRATDRVGIRVLIDGRYPYLVFYTIERDEIVVIHVRHAARKPVR
jgi:toxin ParE1/3/4